ncbi:MAG TPA: hypothetical protein VKS21_09565, partial [Spirochaetota bacterium]|nr:hypothetical protein [Spirochaetota bacterium]
MFKKISVNIGKIIIAAGLLLLPLTGTADTGVEKKSKSITAAAVVTQTGAGAEKTAGKHAARFTIENNMVHKMTRLVFQLALIIFAAKIAGAAARKIKMPA